MNGLPASGPFLDASVSPVNGGVWFWTIVCSATVKPGRCGAMVARIL